MTEPARQDVSMNVRPRAPRDAEACDDVLAEITWLTVRNGCRRGGMRAFYARVGFLPVKEVQLRDWNRDSAILLARVLTPELRRDPPR